MAQLDGSHDGYHYDAFWSVQDDTVFWGAVISRDGDVLGRTKGKLTRAALKDDAAGAVRSVVTHAIDNGVEQHSGTTPGTGHPLDH